MLVSGQWVVRFRAARFSLSVIALSAPVLAQAAQAAPAQAAPAQAAPAQAAPAVAPVPAVAPAPASAAPAAPTAELPPASTSAAPVPEEPLPAAAVTLPELPPALAAAHASISPISAALMHDANAPAEEEWYDSFDVRVFADSYFSLNYNSPKPQSGGNSVIRAFDTSNGFAVAWAGIDIAHAPR